MAYILIVALLLLMVALLVWPSTTAVPPRDAAYVNPEVRLAEQFRSGVLAIPTSQEVVGPLYTKELARYQQQLSLEGQPAHLVDPYWTHFHDYMIASPETVAAELAINPELKYTDVFQTRPMQDFEHANPEVGLVQRLEAFER